jgi:hypothetical protein
MHAAVEQARLRGESLHVLNSTKGDSCLDSSVASECDSQRYLAGAGDAIWPYR